LFLYASRKCPWASTFSRYLFFEITAMTHEKSDNQINSSLFEGPEKLLEIWFAPSAADVPDFESATNGKFGLRKVDRSIWEDMLNVVKCKVLSFIEGDEMDAYLLRCVLFFLARLHRSSSWFGTLSPVNHPFLSLPIASS
jgi:Adenosylmethionine decarboxylase